MTEPMTEPMTQEDDIEGLAGEYVLGSLTPDERRAVALTRRSDRALDAAIAAWERRLAPLDLGLAGVEPPAHAFEQISERLWGEGRRPARVLALRRAIPRWPAAAIGAGALAAALALIVVAIRPVTVAPSSGLVAVLSRSAGAPTADEGSRTQGPPGFVVSIDTQLHTIRVTPQAARPVARRSYHLWLMPDSATAPVSLGGIDPTAPTDVPWQPGTGAAAFANATLAISLEPDGSPLQATPSGPILFTGKPRPAPR